MRKYFDLVLDLLEIDHPESYHIIAQQLETLSLSSTVYFAHRANFFLEAYFDLLRGKLLPEEFVLVGDVESAIPLRNQGKNTSVQLIKQLKNWIYPKEDLIILDQSTREFLNTPSEREQLTHHLHAQGKKLLIN